MNSDPLFLSNHPIQNKIVFVHQGKCGGTSIREALKTYLPLDRYAIFEYHCFDADSRLSEIVENLSSLPNLHFIISLRDPVERLISSFNWALHDLGILDNSGSDYHKKWFEQFKSVRGYVEALLKHEDCHHAIRSIDNFVTHARMGISWYLPIKIARALPKERTYSIRLESLDEDFGNCLQSLMNLESVLHPRSIVIPNEKTDFRSLYPMNSFGNLDDLSYGQIKMLRSSVLAADYAVHNYCMKFVK